MFVYRNFWIVNVSSSVSRIKIVSHFWSLYNKRSSENGEPFHWKKKEEKQTHCVQYMLHINRDYIKCPMEFIWQSLSHCSCFHIKHLEATWGFWQFYYYLGWSPSNLPMCLFIFMGETGWKEKNQLCFGNAQKWKYNHRKNISEFHWKALHTVTIWWGNKWNYSNDENKR